MSESTSDVNAWRIGDWFPDMDSKSLDLLKVFFDSVIESNKSLNLVSPKTLPFLDALHFADGILASRIIYKTNPQMKEIHDFGTGAGFPGLVFAILYPQVMVHLVDSDPKKIDFLRHCVLALGIKNVNLISKGIEGLEESSVSLAMTRGLFNITKTLLLARKSFKKGGLLYHVKGEEWGLEVSEMPTQLCSIWSPSLVSDYKLPIGTFKFSVIRTEKIS